jgi:hypothetical protein
MAKRTKTKNNRRKADYYQTWEERAAWPLLLHLPPRQTFISPCAGAGHLIAHLERHGLRCIEALEKYPKRKGLMIDPARIQRGDAMKLERGALARLSGTVYIENPPWSVPVLHPMIAHLSAQLPTWFLFSSDWASTDQAQPYLPYCRKIVAVGRLKWFPETPDHSADNVSWYLFDQKRAAIYPRRPEFYGKIPRDQLIARIAVHKQERIAA